MSLYLEVWRRPGHAQFGKVVDEPPVSTFSFRDGVMIPGEGDMKLPDSWDLFDRLLLVNHIDPNLSVSSLVRVFDDVVQPPKLVFEWIPKSLLPPESKQSHEVSVSGAGIKSIIEWAVTEAWDWDGSAVWTPVFPDWIYDGPNILTNPGFEEASYTPLVYVLVIDATAGTFTITDGVDVTSAIPYDVGSRTLEGTIETGLDSIDDLLVTPEPGIPLQYTIRMTAESGTFKISDEGGDETTDLAYNISAASLETAIEGLFDIVDVNVTAVTVDGEPGYRIDLVNPVTNDLSIDTTDLDDGSASMQVTRSAGGFEITLVTPPLGVSLSIDDDSGLTGDVDLFIRQVGSEGVTGWTRSMMVSSGVPREYGTYEFFERSSAEAHSGTYSLAIGPSYINSRLDAFTGAQQVRSVTPGGLYQAGIWVFPTAAGQTYRLVIRGIDEDIMLRADGSEARVDVSPPANVWTFVSLSDVVPEDDQIIFRFANTNLSGWPAMFFVDDAFFKEGMAAASIGQILRELYEDATSDHAGRVMWENGASPGTPYLTLDFSDTLDSAGQPWLHDGISIQIWMRMNYLQVMETFADTYGYEWRIVPNNAAAGTWKWQVFNPGSMGTDYSGDPWPGVQGGAEDTERKVEQFFPSLSHSMVEGQGRLTARSTSSDLVSAFGRIELARLDREAPSEQAVTSGAGLDLVKALESGIQYGFGFTDPETVPFVDFELGDTLMIHDPPYVSGPGRLAEVQVVADPVEGTTYETIFLPPEETGPGDE